MIAAALPKEIETSFTALRAASQRLREPNGDGKRTVLLKLAHLLEQSEKLVLEENKKDLEQLEATSTNAFRDRLLLDPNRIRAMSESLRQVAELPDPVGEVLEDRKLKNGLRLRRVRAPLGVILMIFESRPNVALEAFSLAFKSGNAIALRGGSESKSTVACFYQLMRQALTESGFSPDSFFGITAYDRAIVNSLLARPDLVDIVVPRGGDRLIQFVQENAKMPIIKNDRGMCHGYVDSEADLPMAVNVIANAKTHRPGVCNALETLLVHGSIADKYLPLLYNVTPQLQWRCDSRALAILKGKDRVSPAGPHDFDTEHLDLIINCAVVENLEQALAHIEAHGSRHSETILTRNEQTARRFQAEVDAAAVYWNASTRFTDGFEFGLGGELGISTQKLHVRGPVGLRELTTPRWIIDGTGQIR